MGEYLTKLTKDIHLIDKYMPSDERIKELHGEAIQAGLAQRVRQLGLARGDSLTLRWVRVEGNPLNSSRLEPGLVLDSEGIIRRRKDFVTEYQGEQFPQWSYEPVPLGEYWDLFFKADAALSAEEHRQFMANSHPENIYPEPKYTDSEIPKFSSSSGSYHTTHTHEPK